MKEWYVVSTQGINSSKGALQIQSLIDRLEYPNTMIWAPSVRQKVTKHGKEVFDNRSLFSGYIFINTDKLENSKLEQALMEAKLGHFLKLPHDDAHDLPTPISQEDIDHIKSLEEVNAEPIPEDIIDVEIGNLVEVCVGPFMGIKGIISEIKSNHTVVIETIVFGRSAPVSVNINHLSKLTENIKDEKPAE